jgi:hypothetical protein
MMLDDNLLTEKQADRQGTKRGTCQMDEVSPPKQASQFDQARFAHDPKRQIGIRTCPRGRFRYHCAFRHGRELTFRAETSSQCHDHRLHTSSRRPKIGAINQQAFWNSRHFGKILSAFAKRFDPSLSDSMPGKPLSKNLEITLAQR